MVVAVAVTMTVAAAGIILTRPQPHAKGPGVVAAH